MNSDSRIYVAGHSGLVGSALVRKLRSLGYRNLLFQPRVQLELEDQRAVFSFFERERPEYVFLAAAKVGGILANSTYPADFIRSNLTIQLNVVEAAYRARVSKLMFLGSSCIYPKHAEQPISEDALLSGYLEPTNEAYAIAKIAGIKLCQAYDRQFGTNFLSVMPTNLYGPGDTFDLTNSHVVPALIRKFHEAKVNGDARVEAWGTGGAYREFLHVDDMADACVFLMTAYDSPEILNIGSGVEITIRELCMLIREVVGFQGEVVFDRSKPDGTPRKLLDTRRIRGMGWTSKISLAQGLALTYDWYVNHHPEASGSVSAGQIAQRIR